MLYQLSYSRLVEADHPVNEKAAGNLCTGRALLQRKEPFPFTCRVWRKLLALLAKAAVAPSVTVVVVRVLRHASKRVSQLLISYHPCFLYPSRRHFSQFESGDARGILSTTRAVTSIASVHLRRHPLGMERETILSSSHGGSSAVGSA